VNPHIAHARIEAAQPWYSIGLLCLSIGLGAAMLLTSLWKPRRLQRGGAE